MTGDLNKVLSQDNSDSANTDTDLTLTDIEIDEMLKKEKPLGSKRYSRVRKNCNQTSVQVSKILFKN